MTYFDRKVLEMTEIHKTLIESCSPLAKIVLKMMALKNFSKDTLFQSKLPPQLLLATVHQCIVKIASERFKVCVRQLENTHSD